MSFTGRFCLRCGKKESSDEPLIDGLCVDCFVKEKPIVSIPDKIALVRCPVCGSLHMSSSWIPVLGDEKELLLYYIEETVLRKGKTHPALKNTQVVVLSTGNNRAELLVRSLFMNKPAEQVFVINYKISTKLCPKCLSIKTRDYEAILQIRFVGMPAEGVKKRITKLIGSMRSISSNITDFEELREGIDIKFSSVSVARQAASYLQGVLGGYVMESWKLHGIVGGKRRGKLSIVLRIPQLVPGDLIYFKDTVMEVLNIQKDKLLLRDLARDEVLKIDVRSLTRGEFRLLSPNDYLISECEVLDFRNGEVTAKCVEGSIIKTSFPKYLSIGEVIQVITYRDSKYVRRQAGRG
ncbi:MAG: NMD3-related protein [Desulfurococcaceae archaeon TW002]